MGKDMSIDAKIEAARIGGGAVLVTIWGLTLNEWVAVFTGIYMIIQIVIIFPKLVKQVRGWAYSIKRALR
jgi:hypothetical protein